MGGERVLVLRYPGACDRCGESLPQGTKAVHNRETRRVRHLDCAAPAEAEPAPVADARPTIDPGVAGASARREHERRRSRDEARIAARTAAVHATFGSGFWGRVATIWTATSVRVARRDPFGTTRGNSSGSYLSGLGFLGLNEESLGGLTLLGARYYESTSGILLSPDAVLDPDNPAQLQAYAYAWNNPTTFSDPSGLEPASEKKGLADDPKPARPKLPFIPADRYDHFDALVKLIVEIIAENEYILSQTANPDPLFERLFGAMSWFQDSSGAYHAEKMAWQAMFGYHQVMDAFFELGTRMQALMFDFQYEGKSYVLWAWKGDYTNLGAGAELGFYSIDEPFARASDWWKPDPASVALPMSMTLSYGGREIASFEPDEDMWWCTSWVPAIQDPVVADISATFVVDFAGDPGMFDAFQSRYQNSPYWTFNVERRTATLSYRRKPKWAKR